MPTSSGTSKKRIASSAAADPAEHRVERLGLREVAREAVEHEAARRRPAATRRSSIIAIVSSSGTSSPALHDRADLLAELGALGLRGAEHVTGRDVRDPVLRRDALRLRALAGPLRAEDEEVHRRKPS